MLKKKTCFFMKGNCIFKKKTIIFELNILVYEQQEKSTYNVASNY